MAGELTVTKRTFENSTMASKQRRWRVQYSRCFSYPSAYISSHTLNNDNTNHLSLSVLDKNRFVPTWLSTGGSSTVSLQPSEYSPALSVFAVSLLDTVLEEHYVSKLSFAWPQVKCHSGFPTRGSLTLIASYYDSFGEKQKFALRFTTSRDIENFITSLEDLFSDILPELPSAVDVMSAVSSQSEFIPPYRPDTSSIMDPIYASSEPTNFYDENLQESQSQTQSIVAYSENNNAAFPPSFTSLISGCYADPDQNALNLTLVSDIQEPDLKARIAKYMQDESFLDIVSKVNEVIGELGGGFAI